MIFTKEGETADSCIEKMAYQLVRSGQGVYVVTSDWAEQLTILGVGAWRVPARELRGEVLEAEKQIRAGYCGSLSNYRRSELENRLGRDITERLNDLRRGRRPQE